MSSIKRSTRVTPCRGRASLRWRRAATFKTARARSAVGPDGGAGASATQGDPRGSAGRVPVWEDCERAGCPVCQAL
eukprot:9697506-Lingulodinium_polyedra.AAC.1